MMQLNIERTVLEKLLHSAGAASRLLGHLDDNVGGAALGPIAERALSELLGDPRAIIASVPDACFVFPESPDDGGEAEAILSFGLTVAASDRTVERKEVLGMSRSHGEQAARVSPATTLIAWVVFAAVAAAVIGGTP